MDLPQAFRRDRLEPNALLGGDHQVAAGGLGVQHLETWGREGRGVTFQGALHANRDQGRSTYGVAERHVDDAFALLIADISICFGYVLSGDAGDSPLHVGLRLDPNFARRCVLYVDLYRGVQCQLVVDEGEHEPVIGRKGGYDVIGIDIQPVGGVCVLVGIEAAGRLRPDGGLVAERNGREGCLVNLRQTGCLADLKFDGTVGTNQQEAAAADDFPRGEDRKRCL